MHLDLLSIPPFLAAHAAKPVRQADMRMFLES